MKHPIPKIKKLVIDHEAAGLAVRKARRAANITLQKLAAFADMSIPTLSRLERGATWTEEEFAAVMTAIETLSK